MTPDVLPPQDLDAEAALLGAALIDGRLKPEVAGRVAASMFYREAHGIVWQSLLNLHHRKEPIDLLTAQQALADRGMLEHVGGTEALLGLTSACASAANAMHYAERVREMAARRYVIRCAQRTVERAHDMERPLVDTLGAMADEARKGMDGLRNADSLHSLADLADATHEYAEKAMEGEIEPGVACGIPMIDRLTYGWMQGTMNILAARPAVGKTAMAMNWCLHAASQKMPCAFVSYEMDPQVLARRTMAAASGFSYGKLRTGGMDQKDWQELGFTAATWSALPMWIIDAVRMQVADVEIVLRSIKDLRFVVIDYLQLIPGPGRTGYERTSGNSGAVRELARVLRIPIVALCQLSRAVENREDREPDLCDLRESGQIEQDADTVMFLWRTTKPDGSEPYPVHMKFGKQRFGPLGRGTLTFDPKRLTFTEGGTQ